MTIRWWFMFVCDGVEVFSTGCRPTL